MPERRCCDDDRQRHEATVQICEHGREDRDRRDRPAPLFVLSLAGPERHVNEREGKQVRTDQKMDRADGRREDGHDDGDHRRAAVAHQARAIAANKEAIPSEARAIAPDHPHESTTTASIASNAHD